MRASVFAALASCLVVWSCGAARREPPPPPPLDGLAAIEPVAFSPDDDLSPAVTPDGRHVVYVSQQNGNLDVWVRDFGRNSTYPVTLNPADDFDPTLGPDGELLVFVSRRSDAKGDLYFTRGFEPAANPEALTDPTTQDRQPVVAPDGTTIYFTSAVGIGLEFISAVSLDDRIPRRVSPTPGFDPAVSPDGRYLVYTAPAFPGIAEHPHLIALRLADSATRALTKADAPEGFAKFLDDRALVIVRFSDDDNRDGSLDANDQASLWRLSIDLDRSFSGAAPFARPEPLTDGSGDELFATASGGWLYFTQGSRQQDVVRLPLSGLFPEFEDPAAYFSLAKTIDDPRTRWFALKKAAARAEPGSRVEAQAQLEIGHQHIDSGRPDLARAAYRAIVETQGQVDRAGLVGLAEVELLSIDRQSQEREATTPEAREAVLAGARVELDRVRLRHRGSSAVEARIELELAELILASGDRVRAVAAFERVAELHANEPAIAARALLLRVGPLGVAHDPDAIGEAYAKVIERFPEEREVVNEAARQLVTAQVRDLARGEGWRSEIDVLRRLIPRYGSSPVRTEARGRLAELLREHKAHTDAALELLLVKEEVGGDRYAGARAQRALGEVYEAAGLYDQAIESWASLRASFGDLPGYASLAREALTRLTLEKAKTLDAAGDKGAARLAYASVIENDLTQARAHRRFMALSAETGHLDEAIEGAEARAKAQPRTPIARWAHGLALSYLDPPDFDLALDEIEEAIRLNPQFTYAYITRGWLREMAELEEPGWLESIGLFIAGNLRLMVGGALDVPVGQSGPLEQAIDDYKTALSLNPESVAPETEAEILVDLANAQYRVGEQAKDASNMRGAFERYLEALQLGLRFDSEVAEMVFWERLGRAASWVEDYAISTMATRRAVALAKRLKIKSRLPQLNGNLALAYAEAGEEVYSRQALDEFHEALVVSGFDQKLVVSFRNRARARLDAGNLDPTALDAILGELKASREHLEKVDVIDRGELPTLWFPLEADATLAQFGFNRRAELDLNLTLTERAHRSLGEARKVAAIRQLRDAVTRDLLDSPEKEWGLTQEPWVLSHVRERIGLVSARAKTAFEAGDVEAAMAAIEEARVELEAWSEAGRSPKDRVALALDRARLAALAVELHGRARSKGLHDESDPAALAKRLTEAEAGIQTALVPISTSTAPPPLPVTIDLDELPSTVASTAAIDRWVDRALGPPKLNRLGLETRAILARLAYDHGLLAWMSAQDRLSGPRDLKGLILGLDGAGTALGEAFGHFERAARLGATGGPVLGGRILSLSLSRLDRLCKILRRPTFDGAGPAEKIALATGDRALASALILGAGTRGDKAAREAALVHLDREWPGELRESLPDAYEVLAQTASTALANDDVAGALPAIDRWLLLSQGPGRQPRAPHAVAPSLSGSTGDQAFMAGLGAHTEHLERARLALLGADVDTATVTYAGLLGSARAASDALWAHLDGAKLSERAAAEGRAKSPLDLDGLTFELGPREALVAYAPIGGYVHALLVDGSTTAKVRARHLVLDRPASEISADLDAIDRASSAGILPEAAVVARTRASLVTPLASLIDGKDVLLLAAGLIGGPLPRQLFDLHGPAPAEIGAPSIFGMLRAAQVAGSERSVAIGRPDDELYVASQRLFGPEARGLATRKAPPRLEPGEARSIDELSIASRVLGRAVDRLVIDAPIHLEATALGRSGIDLLPPPDPDKEPTLAEAADGFSEELPLDAIDIPTRVLILGRVEGPSFALIGLPLAGLSRGVATTITVPANVPTEVTRRVLTAYAQMEPEVGVARAVHLAIAKELSTTPALGRAMVLGAPGLDAAGSKAYAAEKLSEAKTISLGAMAKRQYADSVPWLERWIWLQKLSGKDEQLEQAYGLLISVLQNRLEPPDYVRALESQSALLAFLEEKKKPARNVADAMADLASIKSDAHDYVAAEAMFTSAIETLEPLDDVEGLARVYFKFGAHKKNAQDYEGSALLMERSIGLYERISAFDRPRVAAKKGQPVFPQEAAYAIRQVGETYLNALSDPVRAKKAYQRVLRYAATEEDKVRAEIDLVRVDRRAGDFQGAAERANRVAERSEKAGLRDWLLSAVVEGANVAWYQGNYRLGGVLCQKSLDLADELLAAEKKESLLPAPKPGTPAVRKLNKRILESTKIFALSVCGVIAMSQRNFEQAKQHLERARRIAQKIDNPREVATQFNNLGRAFLEFGRVEEAIGAFLEAKAIDERLNDRYALAYDLRNLGGAYAAKKESLLAEATLEQGLAYAMASRDTNNELRARFALAEVYKDMGRLEAAEKGYREALPLAKRLGVKELAWQIHRSLGLLMRARQPDLAEKELRQAIAIARSITGRSAPSDFGPDRYAAFDDLIMLLIESGRADEAFVIANQARALEQVELLEDDRLVWSTSEVPALISELRLATTATQADLAWSRLAAIEPRLVATLRPASVAELTAGLAPDTGIVCYRVLADRVLIFSLASSGLEVAQAKVSADALRELLREYGRQMAQRSEPREAYAHLAKILIEPIRPRLEGIKRIAVVPHDLLRYVAFAALPLDPDGGTVLLDRMVLTLALDPLAAKKALADRSPLGALPIAALGAPAQPAGASDPPLPFALRELQLIAEEDPAAKITTGAAVTRAKVLEALAGHRGIFHFAGHGYLAGADPRGRFVDPLGGQLRTSDLPVTMLDVLGTRTEAELVILSACSSLIWPKKSAGTSGGDELLSMTQAFQLAGARRVLATTLHVHDLAASLVMKHFYRQEKTLDVAAALREAQLQVRRAYPHPAWWASFVLVGG